MKPAERKSSDILEEEKKIESRPIKTERKTEEKSQRFEYKAEKIEKFDSCEQINEKIERNLNFEKKEKKNDLMLKKENNFISEKVSIDLKESKQKEKDCESNSENMILNNDEEMSRILLELQEIVTLIFAFFRAIVFLIKHYLKQI